MLKSTLLTLFTLLILTTSSPTPSEEKTKRYCTVQRPDIINVLSASDPDNAHYTGFVNLTRTAGNPGQNTQSTALSFVYIPQGSTGCMLQFTLPALKTENQIASGTATQADIWTTEPWDRESTNPTWNNPPQKREMVATAIFPTWKTDQVFETVLASNVCSRPMSFLVELSTWQTGEGEVSFFNSRGEKPGMEVIGFSMRYNC